MSFGKIGFEPECGFSGGAGGRVTIVKRTPSFTCLNRECTAEFGMAEQLYSAAP